MSHSIIIMNTATTTWLRPTFFSTYFFFTKPVATPGGKTADIRNRFPIH